MFHYMPLKPRLGRLFQTVNLIQLLHEHCTREDDGVLRDLWDTDRWKRWYSSTGEFEGDVNGICLGFCSDGVNPFKSMHCQYSMWPLMITVMNFPIALRKSIAGILLLGKSTRFNFVNRFDVLWRSLHRKIPTIFSTLFNTSEQLILKYVI